MEKKGVATIAEMTNEIAELKLENCVLKSVVPRGSVFFPEVDRQ